MMGSWTANSRVSARAEGAVLSTFDVIYAVYISTMPASSQKVRLYVPKHPRTTVMQIALVGHMHSLVDPNSIETPARWTSTSERALLRGSVA